MTAVTGDRFLAGILDASDADGFSIANDRPVIDFTVKKIVFEQLLQRAATVLPRTGDVMPVLKHFQIQVAPKSLRVTGSDCELTYIAATSMVSVASPGTAVFPAKQMLDIMRTATDADVHIKVADNVADITIGPTTWRRKLLPGHEYPKLPDVGDVTFTTVNRTQFAAGLAAVRYAASREAERISLMVINVAGGKMTACDGARIQQAAIPDLPFDLQLPIDAVDDLVKLLKSVTVDTIAIGRSVSGSATKIIFKLGSDVLFVNTLNAVEWPGVEKTLLRPALTNKTPLRVPRAALIEAIRRVRIAADTNTSAIALRLEPDKLTITARDKNGDAEETLPVDYAGPTRQLAVNHTFLMDMLSGYAPTECLFLLGDDTATRRSPLLLSDTDAGTTGVIQQMKLDWVGA